MAGAVRSRGAATNPMLTSFGSQQMGIESARAKLIEDITTTITTYKFDGVRATTTTAALRD